MPSGGVEPEVPAIKQLHNNALNHTATGIGLVVN